MLRGMMDEYKFGAARHRLLAEWWKDIGKVLAAVGVLVLIVLNVVQVVLALSTGH